MSILGPSPLRSDYGKTPSVVEIGQVISSKYKLLRLLGDGGMGSVYEAEHLRLGTRVALKILHSDLARKAGLIDRFLQEARVSAQIRSPHVVQVTDVESTPDGIAYLVMELLQGEPLSTVEKRERTLSVATAGEYTLQILQALEAAHSIGVIHRDLKPDNVFLVFDGTKPIIKLIDFGIAKLKRAEGATGAGQKNLTVAGMLMGTPEYMAPEQAYSAADIDVRADLYSVGVMLYEMLSGQTPAQGEDPRIVVLKVERGEVKPLVHVAPNVPPEVAGLVHRAMAPRPEMRFASATEMRLALEAVLAGKRPPTARIQAVAPATGAVALAAPLQNPGSGPPPPVAPQPAEVRTGTVMGGPAEGAFTPSPPNNAQAPGTGTARAAPIDLGAIQQQQMQQQQMQQPMQPMQQPQQPMMGYGSERPPNPTVDTRPPPRGGRQEQKSGAGLIIALAIVALLLGAGAVVAYVMSTQSPTPVAIEPLPTVTTLTATAPITPTAPVTVVPNGPITPLTPVAPQQPVPVGPGPGPKPHPSGSAAPHPSGGAADGGAPPNVFPPFPSAFPSTFPSAFPPFPSGFPTFQAPSGFPPLFPPSQPGPQ